MDNRREFLKSTVGMVAANFGAGSKSLRLPRSLGGAGNAGELPRPEDVLDIEKMKPRGHFQEATVPETLDLAERARLSVHNLTHNLDPNNHYFVWQTIKFGPPAEEASTGPKQVGGVARGTRGEARVHNLCLNAQERQGPSMVADDVWSDEALDREYGMMKAMMDNVRADGLMYQPADTLDQQKDTSAPLTDGILGLAYENHYALDGNPLWLDWIERLASGLKKAAIRVDDRAYYPGECNLTPGGKWVWHLRGPSMIPYSCTDEPFMDAQGVEAVKLYHGYQMRALVRAYKYKGDQESLDLARRLTRFELKPWMWENTTLEGVSGNEHGIFYGHFHGHVMNLLALLDVAEAEKNTWLKGFVREGYHDAVRHGVVRMGWFPCWVMPTKYGRDVEHFGDLSSINETCGMAEMAELGVRLSDAGLGDYWDDVDAIARNQLAEHQFCNLAAMRQMCKGALRVEDYYGGFGVGSPTGIDPQMYGCCSANGAIGLYYVWHGITRFRDGVATVNLFLNRASAWMDVESHLPYEGKVELHNRLAKTALVRIPDWVDMDEVKSSVNDETVRPQASGRYLIFDGLQKGATIRLKFPNPETIEHYTINGQHYQLTFRGSTVVDIEPRSKDRALVDWDKGIYFPLYRRSEYRADKAPRHTVHRFVAEKVLPLQ